MKLSLPLLVLASLPAFAELKVPQFFSDGMVLQRDDSAKIWGWAKPGADIKVSLGSQALTAKTSKSGDWVVDFKGLKASDASQTLTIEGDGGKKEIKDVLVGEVWLASGQSNMEWRVSSSDGAEKEIAGAKDPLLRVFVSSNVAKGEPQKDWSGSWNPTEPDNTKNFTAVGYYFAKQLRAELGVPVGIIECAWGGKPVEAFTSMEALKALPEAKGVVEKRAKAEAAWDPKRAMENFNKQKAAFDAKLKEWQKEKKGKKPRGPRKPTDPGQNPSLASTIYNGMISPLAGYGAKGAIWYQGESNANGATASVYEELLGCMVADWRKRWGNEMSFYWVQLANFRAPTTTPGVESDWVVVQDEMRRALKSIPKGGMAVINEIGAANDIHPRNKLDVGKRLARWALNQDYGKKDVVVSGPLYSGSEIKDGKIIVSFDHAVGLKSRDGKPLQRFEIAGADGKWDWAQATIENGKVILSSNTVNDPKKARYAWATNPTGANLVNAEGLPASCFTTE